MNDTGYKTGYFLLFVSSIWFIADPYIFPLLFIATCCLALVHNRHCPNITGLILVILTMKLVEIPLWLAIDNTNNYVVFGSYFLIDAPVILIIALRVPLSRYIHHKRFGQYNANDYTITNADLVLGKIYICYCIINLLALFENFLRHLDDLGFSADANYSIWLYKNARLIWDNYEYIKHGMNILEFLAILTTMSNYMRSRVFNS